MTKTSIRQLRYFISFTLFFFCLLNSKNVLALDWKDVDVNTPESQWVEEDTILKQGNGTFVASTVGTASKNGWTRNTVHIVTKEKEVKSLTVSLSKVSINIKETKQLQLAIKALEGYDTVSVSSSNNNVVQVTELTSNRLRNEAGETVYTYKLTPLGVGTATILFTSSFDPSFTSTVTVSVKSTVKKKPIYYVSNKNGKYTYSSLVSDLLSITKLHQKDKPVKLYKIGTSLDKRSIYCLQISNPKAKKKVILTAGMHGREYMNPYFVMDNIEDMLNHYDTSSSKKGYTYRQLYNEVCLYVIPMLNPDGISIAQQGAKAIKNKALRANVQKIQKRLGISYRYWKGNARNVDLNRNFPVGWEKLSSYRKEGSSGSKAGSEPETKCLMNYIKKIKPSAVISYHSMGERIYWGYAVSKSSTFYKQSLAIQKISTGLTGYYAVPPHRSKKSACGCLEDWLAYKKKIPTLCIETGNVPCPLPIKQYTKIYSKNKLVVETICNYFRNSAYRTTK